MGLRRGMMAGGNGLLSMIRFEGANGSTTFTDDVAGVTWTRSDSAEISTAQFYSGASSMYLPNVNGYDGLNGPSGLIVPSGVSSVGFSIEAKIYVTDANGFQFGANPVCGQTIASSNGEQWFGLLSGNVIYSRSSAHPSGALTVQGGTAAATNQWHKVKMTYDGTTIRIYLNDVLEASAASSYGWNNTGGDFTLGYSVVAGFEASRLGLRGYMDDFQAVRA